MPNADRLQRLNQLQKALLGPGRLDEKLKKITDGVVEIFNADFCRIWLSMPGDRCDSVCIHAKAKENDKICRLRERCLHLIASSGRYTHIEGPHSRMPFGMYKLGRVAAGKISKFLTNDAVNDPQIMDHEWARGLGLVSFAGYKLQDTDGEPIGVLALFSKQSITPEEDAMLEGLAGITAHVIQTVKAEGAVKAERDKLINILQSMEDGVYIVSQAYDIEYINPVIEREFGPVEGRKCYEYFHGRDKVCSWCKNLDVFVGKTVRWEWYSAKNNKTYDLLDTPLHNYDGSISKLEIFRDITERRQAEEELKTSYNLLHTVIDEIIDAIFVKDLRGRYLLINDPGARLIGKTKEEVIGKDDSQLFVPEAARQIMEGDRSIIDSGVTRTYEEDLVAATGIKHTYLTTKGPFRNHEGKVIGVIGIARDITERKHEEEMIQHLAYYDVLTGLPNRTLLHDRLQQAIFEAKSANRPLVLLVMDLDRFKEINNTLGHHSGDIILKQAGARLRNALPETAILARTGGDEFAVILPDTDAENANRIADSFMKSLKEPFTLEGIAINVNASIGMVPFPGYGDDANTLMQYADMAMYRAKNTKSGLTIYSPQYNQYSPERLALIGELRHSIDSDQMFLLYQPKIDLKTGSPVGVEALVRWQHPRLGVIPPNQFIALAEHTGLIKDLTLWVIKEALRQSHAWKQEGLQVCVAVNLSMQNLQVPELLEQIKVLLSTSSVTPDNLRLELTESTIMRDPERSMDILAQLAAIDIHFSIDDFGTGYSSLGYLQKLPVDEIKIDKSFVINMMEDEHSIAIVHSIIELAHSLRLKVVAEGVENKEIMKRLGLLRCDMAQGYFISRPIPGSEVKGWLELGVKGD